MRSIVGHGPAHATVTSGQYWRVALSSEHNARGTMDR